jgi:hypothetical protein
MPETNFQNNDPIVMPLLSQAQLDDDQQQQQQQPPALSSFTDSIKQATLCNQSLSHYQRSLVEQESQGASSIEFWTRHQQLESGIARGVERLSLDDHCANLHSDSLPLLTHMTTQAAIITMYKTMHTTLSQAELSNHQDAMGKMSHMVLPAAQRMTALSKELAELSYFQVRFLPSSLSLSLLLSLPGLKVVLTDDLRCTHSFPFCFIIVLISYAHILISTLCVNSKLYSTLR